MKKQLPLILIALVALIASPAHAGKPYKPPKGAPPPPTSLANPFTAVNIWDGKTINSLYVWKPGYLPPDTADQAARDQTLFWEDYYTSAAGLHVKWVQGNASTPIVPYVSGQAIFTESDGSFMNGYFGGSNAIGGVAMIGGATSGETDPAIIFTAYMGHDPRFMAIQAVRELLGHYVCAIPDHMINGLFVDGEIMGNFFTIPPDWSAQQAWGPAWNTVKAVLGYTAPFNPANVVIEQFPVPEPSILWGLAIPLLARRRRKA